MVSFIILGSIIATAFVALTFNWVWKLCIEPIRQRRDRVVSARASHIFVAPEQPPRYSDVAQGHESYELQSNPQHRTGHARQASGAI